MRRINFRYETAYEQLTDDSLEGVVSCGFLPKDMEEVEHELEYYSGFLVISGSGRYVEGDDISIPLGPGDFVQRRPGVKHVTFVEKGSPWLEFYICFGPSLYRTLVETHMISDQPVLTADLGAQTMAKCESILSEFKSVNSESKKTLLCSLQSFLFHINGINQEETDGMTTPDLIKEMCIKLSSNYGTKINYEEMAKDYQVGYESMRKTFKRYTGMSPNRYRLIQRIDEARKRLEMTDMNLKAIALELGYADQYAFSSQFKKVVGISPKKYREGDE